MGIKGPVCALAFGLMACGGGDDGATPPDAAGAGADADRSCNVLFLNFEGASLTPGPDSAPNDTSSIISAAVTAPAYRAADPDRATKIATITTQVTNRLTPRGVTVVTERPAAGPYAMVMMGGESDEVGLSSGIGAIAPFQGCGMRPEAPILFSFDAVNGISVSLFQSGSGAIGAYLVNMGLPTSNDPTNCLCWNAPECTADFDCKLVEGEVSRDPNAICGSGDTFDELALLDEALTCGP